MIQQANTGWAVNVAELFPPVPLTRDVEQFDVDDPATREMFDTMLNVSNDEAYAGSTELQTAATTRASLRHTPPAMQMHRVFFPLFWSSMRLRNFHRPTVRKFVRGAIAAKGEHKFFPVASLVNVIKEVDEERERSKKELGIFEYEPLLRSASYLRGKDSELIMIEYSEQYPPLIEQPGMATVIRNYYSREAKRSSFKYGRECSSAKLPYFECQLNEHKALQSLESDLYKAPIFAHTMPSNRFLIIRTRNGMFLRRVDTVFVAGQEFPMVEVPNPHSRKAQQIHRDHYLMCVYRLFWKSEERPRRVSLEELSALFPMLTEENHHKILRRFADKRHTPKEGVYWKLKPDRQLPSHEEINAMLSPETLCAYFSMLAAEQRLSDIEYADCMSETYEGDDEVMMELEVKCAPWNTSEAYLSHKRGRSMLDMNGLLDPTGDLRCGFSFMRKSGSTARRLGATHVEVPEPDEEKRTRRYVTPESDLRRLSLDNAREVLRQFNVPEDELMELSRWEAIDAVRTLSTWGNETGIEEEFSRYARGQHKYTWDTTADKFQRWTQQQFDKHLTWLSQTTILSDDEEGTEEDVHEDAPDVLCETHRVVTDRPLKVALEYMSAVDMPPVPVQYEWGIDKELDKSVKAASYALEKYGDTRRLLIVRRSESGAEDTVSIAPNELVIELYRGLRETLDYNALEKFANEQQTDATVVKRVLEHCAREALPSKQTHSSTASKVLEAPKSAVQRQNQGRNRCSACGELGHTCRNRVKCPLFSEDAKPPIHKTKRPKIEPMDETDVETMAETSSIGVRYKPRAIKREPDFW